MRTIISFFFAMLVALLISQSVVSEENQHPDVFDIEYPAVFRHVANEAESAVAPAARSCTNHICHRLCRALYYRTGRCISSTVCRCTR
ncbi:hypothetical protein KGM_202030 [Danaus plexippus plexippus]|uniref:Defensin n=1 Tax=Danaus plexippus plexippus TaxID=278856 RepID=A0A212EV84_DANPL|nr:hypothetical protein KGM_202030 [Danaus plexippus plexippus]